MIAVEGEGAKYWPRWRGPSGQGYAATGGYPDTWSATQNVAWRTAVPGRGNSSPIVWADRIFLTTAYDGWSEPNASSRDGPRAPLDVLARHFCVRAEHPPWRLLVRCK